MKEVRLIRTKLKLSLKGTVSRELESTRCTLSLALVVMSPSKDSAACRQKHPDHIPCQAIEGLGTSRVNLSEVWKEKQSV